MRSSKSITRDRPLLTATSARRFLYLDPTGSAWYARKKSWKTFSGRAVSVGASKSIRSLTSENVLLPRLNVLTHLLEESLLLQCKFGGDLGSFASGSP